MDLYSIEDLIFNTNINNPKADLLASQLYKAQFDYGLENKQFHNSLIGEFSELFPNLYLSLYEHLDIKPLTFIHNLNPKMFGICYFLSLQTDNSYPIIICGSNKEGSCRDFFITRGPPKDKLYIQNNLIKNNYSDLPKDSSIATLECKLKTTSKRALDMLKFNSFKRYIEDDNHFVIADISNLNQDLQNQSFTTFEQFKRLNKNYQDNIIINNRSFINHKSFFYLNQITTPVQYYKVQPILRLLKLPIVRKV